LLPDATPLPPPPPVLAARLTPMVGASILADMLLIIRLKKPYDIVTRNIAIKAFTN
jgi:hypothetical protein